MKFNFDKRTNDFLKIIVESAKKQNINVYFVGGVVRDNLLKLPLRDIDLIVDSNAVEFSKNLPDDIKIKSVHKDFATVKVQFQNLNIDIASTREEEYPFSGCLPVVNKIGVDVTLDYKRRDFSVNSLYCKIDIKNNNLTYELIDLCNGQTDIKNKTLRVLHNKSYIDDPTRILRGVDFKYRFNFDFSLNDKKLISEYLLNPSFDNASTDRILSVFKKTVNSDNFKEIIDKQYYKLINSDNLKIDFDFINKISSVFMLDSEFFTDVILNSDINKVALSDETAILNEFSKYPVSYLAYYFYKTKDKNVLTYLKIKDIKLLINGDDLINRGYQKGRQIGQILKAVLKEKIKNPSGFVCREDELKMAEFLFPQKAIL